MFEVPADLPYSHLYGLRRLTGEQPPLTSEQEAAREALQAEADRIEAEFAEAEEFSDEADQRMGEIETALEALDDRPVIFDTEEVAIAGAVVSIDAEGRLRVDRGYVRREDEPPVVEPEPASEVGAADARTVEHIAARIEGDDTAVETASVEPEPAPEPEEDEGMRPIPDRLLNELTAYRTVALREALGADPHIAFLAALHALVLRRFYSYSLDTCLEIDAKSSGFAGQPPGLGETWSAKSLDLRHRQCAERLPKEPEALWDALMGFDTESCLSMRRSLPNGNATSSPSPRLSPTWKKRMRYVPGFSAAAPSRGRRRWTQTMASRSDHARQANPRERYKSIVEALGRHVQLG